MEMREPRRGAGGGGGGGAALGVAVGCRLEPLDKVLLLRDDGGVLAGGAVGTVAGDLGLATVGWGDNVSNGSNDKDLVGP